MNRQEKRSQIYAGVLFLIWPFLATLVALRQYKKPWAKNIAWAFVAFFGFTFAIGSASAGNDIVRYAAELESLHKVQLTFSGAINYFLQSGEIDIVRTIISVVLSRFTGSQAVLTGVYGIIFGYFFSRNMWFILDRLEGNIKPYTLLLFACFFLVVPIWDINGFRMWTAAHVFLYGLLPYLFDGNKKGLWIACTSILVHFSFVIPIALLFAHSFLGPRLTLYFGVYIVTFFISEINIELINRYVEAYTPEIFQERTKYYRMESKVEAMSEGGGSQRSWHIRWYGRALGWAIGGFLVLFYLKGKDFFLANRGWRDLFSFTLLFFAAANVLSMLPSGSRYATVARLIALAFITLYIQNKYLGGFLQIYKKVVIPALLLFILVSVRLGLLSISATAVLGNPLVAIFVAGNTISLNNFLIDILKAIL